MSLPQLIGMKCVACQKSIGSVLDGAFCEACGNPAHRKCLATRAAGPADPPSGQCPACGGNAESGIAREVRRERGAQAQQESRAVAAQERGGPVAYPVSKICPQCGSGDFTRVRPERWIAFAWDRVCGQCGTRYSPPTPLWAALVFLAIGLGFTALGVVAFTAGDVCTMLLGPVGILAIIHGIRSILKPGRV